MSDEGQELDRKSIRYALGKHEQMDGLACDCVGFANAAGGHILLGIEDGESEPPPHQKIPDDLTEKIRKRISQITANVNAVPVKKTSPNGGEYVDIQVTPNAQSIAAMSDGRYFLRVSDETRRLQPDDLGRLIADRNTFIWELQTNRRVPVERHDPDKLATFLQQLRASERVSNFLKGKTGDELLNYYLFVKDGFLTNLGVMWIGQREDRAALLYAPEIQCIKFDERGRKARKFVWNDYSKNPMELIEAVWNEVPEWKDSFELPAGLFRKTVPHYEEVVIRELLANALVHRPYTQRGDIFINLYADHLEIHNPGLLPVGVTPRNILHTSVKRNPHLARVFYDLKLMEGEGSGYDRMYEVCLMSGRPTPVPKEGDDRVIVTVQKQIVNPQIIDFMTKADQTFQPTQKELIALGLIAQHEALTALQLQKMLALSSTDELKPWLGNLKKWGLIDARGQTKATEYFVDPDVLRKLEYKGATTLKGIEKHRLRELILKDLEIYKKASIGEIHSRIGLEIPRRKVKHELKQLSVGGIIGREGSGRTTVYLWTKTP